MTVPESFRALVSGRPPDAPGTPSGDAWLDRLPRLVEEHLAAWNLTPDGGPRHGECALVVPVRRGGERWVLKITWPHAEARWEHLALRLWDGRGAVRLVAANPHAAALLLERLSPVDLRSVGILDACVEIGTLLARLDRPADPRLDSLADAAVRWRARFAAGSPLVPRRLTQQAAGELEELLADQGPPRLVHIDLHDGNVLRSDRGWLAIDPKPMAGEPAFAVAPIVWNRAEEAARAHDLRTHVRLRADLVADAAGLDPDRVRAWTHLRLVLSALNAAAHAPASDDFRTRMIATAKAFSS